MIPELAQITRQYFPEKDRARLELPLNIFEETLLTRL